MNTINRIGNRNANHLYRVEVAAGQYVEVDANSATQAASVAKRAGYEVRSINMIG